MTLMGNASTRRVETWRVPSGMQVNTASSILVPIPWVLILTLRNKAIAYSRCTVGPPSESIGQMTYLDFTSAVQHNGSLRI